MTRMTKRVLEKLQKYSSRPQIRAAERRKLKKVGQSMRREMRANKERGDSMSDGFVEEVLEQRRIIKEYEGAEGAGSDDT